MKLNRQRKVYLGVLGTALIGLAVDRMLGGALPGPQGAEASSLLIDPSDRTALLPQDDEAKLPDGMPASEAGTSRRTMLTVAAQLEALSKRGTSTLPPATCDAFAMPATLFKIVRPEKVEVLDKGVVEQAKPAGVAAEKLKLTTIVIPSPNRDANRDDADPSERFVVIDGQTLKVGEAVSGWRVVSVDQKSVTVENTANERAVLVLPDAVAGLGSRR